MSVYTPKYTTQFKKDYKLLKKRGYDISKLEILMKLLLDEKPLSMTYKDHSLSGTWKGARDAHIEPDWILIYRYRDTIIEFERTGTHSDLFE